MKCMRCQGSMVYRKFYDPQEQFWGWRSIYSGEIIDQIPRSRR